MKKNKKTVWIPLWKIFMIWILAAAIAAGSWTMSRAWIYEDLMTAMDGNGKKEETAEADDGSEDTILEDTGSESIVLEEKRVQTPYTQVFAYTDRIVNDAVSAMEALKDMQGVIGCENADAEFTTPEISQTQDYNYYRFEQQYESYPVYGRTAILSTSKQGNVNLVTGNYRKLGDMDLKVQVTLEQAAEAVQQHMMQTIEVEDTSIVPFVISEGLCIYSYSEIPVLTWKVYGSYGNEAILYFVAADDGSIIAVQNAIPADETYGTGVDENGNEREFATKQLEEGTYVLRNEERKFTFYNANGGNTKVVNGFLSEWDSDDFYEMDTIVSTESGVRYKLCKNGKEGEYYAEVEIGTNRIRLYENEELISDDAVLVQDIRYDLLEKVEEPTDADNVWEDAKAVSLAANVQDAWDFYNQMYGRQGYDNQNSPMQLVYNDLKGLTGNPDNSFSSTFWFGKNSNSVLRFGANRELTHDLIGHEYTHSNIRFICQLDMQLHETGAIEEGICDVFGELIEDYADGTLDNSNDWLHNTRNLRNPGGSEPDPLPEVYKGSHWADSDDADYFAHHNSTVISHAMYLISEGIDGRTDCEGIGNRDLAYLLYYTLHAMPMDTDFSQLAGIMIQVAGNMKSDGYLNARQLRCVYESLAECGILPTYRVDEQAELIFYDADRQPVSEYAIGIGDISIQENGANLLYGSYDMVNVNSSEAFRLNLTENKMYHLIVHDVNNPEMDFECYLDTGAPDVIQMPIDTGLIFQQDVLNNGGRYVSYQGKTYYWKYSGDSYTSSGLYGNYEKTEAVNQLICRTGNGLESVITTENAYGKLFICGDRIFYETRSDGWYSVLLDGSKKKSHGSKKYVAAETTCKVMIYQNQEDGEFYSESMDGTTRKLSADNLVDDEWPTFLAVYEGSLYYYRTARTGEAHVNVVTCRANIQEETAVYQGSKTVECPQDMGISCDIEFDGNQAYLSYTNVGGSGLFHSHGGVYRMQLDADMAITEVVSQNSSDALCYSDIAVGVDAETGGRKLIFHNASEWSEAGINTRPWIESDIREMNLENGFVTNSSLPLILDKGYALHNGNVVVCQKDEVGVSTVISAATLQNKGYTGFDGYSTGNGYAIQYVEVVGDIAYISVEKIEEDPENSIGWRTAYRRAETVIYETRIGSDQLTELYRY